MIKQIAIAAITMLMLDGVYLNAMSTQYGEQIAKVQRTAMNIKICLLYTSPSPRDRQKSRMPSSA